jgi:nucleoside-diphosphate-sugar epimerase
MKKIAILGATGYVGRSLVREFFLEKKSYHLSLFSRSKEKLHTHIPETPKKVEYSAHSYDDFHKGEYDVIINCTGISSSPNVQKNPFELFKVTEEVDSLVIDYLHHNPKALYVNISSGVVYGENFETSVTEKSKTILPAGFFEGGESYAITKINAEAKHRALSAYNIVDIRVFGFFGALVDVDSPFLMSEIVKSLRDKKVFVTNKDDIIRDYVTACDLLTLITLVMKKTTINDYFDIYSKKPISKFALLKALTKKYKLDYTITVPTAKTKMIAKNAYFSKSKKATTVLGYKPERTSLDGILSELDRLGL